ncbi:MAG TPA: hypothetical protein VK900_08665, partial [Anaerolineales bacterium]|nr:hypothetical protein [Anaerolineales bacterium]
MRIKRMPITLFILAALALSVLAAPTSVQAKPPGPASGGSEDAVSCRLPKSNADALYLLSNYYPGYWWDHT